MVESLQFPYPAEWCPGLPFFTRLSTGTGYRIMSRVLVVDDEPYIRRSLSFVLSQEGYEVESVGEGNSAWQMLERWRPDAVFLDLMLPQRSGYDLCRSIRSSPDLSPMVVIMLTAKGQEVDQARGMAAGADEYCTKPFSPREITQRLRLLLEKRPTTVSSDDLAPRLGPTGAA